MAKPLLRLSPKKEALGDGVTYWMDVEKDQFLHFTTMSRARAILDSGGLMLDPPPGIKKFGGDGVYAISIVYGRSVPGTQRTHINPLHGPIVAVVFKTKTVPVVGFREEVRWDRDVNFTAADIVGPEVALALINLAPESLKHSDDLVLYDDAHKPAAPAARASKARVGASKGGAGRAGRSFGRSAPYHVVDFRTMLPTWRMHYGDLVATRATLERLLGPIADGHTYWTAVDATNSNKVFRISLRDEREAPEASLWSLVAYGEAMPDDVAVFTDWLSEGGVGLRPLSPAYSFMVGDLVAVHGKGPWRVEAIAHRQGRGAAAAQVTVSSETLSGDFARVPAKAVRKIVEPRRRRS